MDHRACAQLDDYLAAWMADGERARFEAHLSGCPVCRQQVEHQRRIDRLLAQGTEQLEPVPSSLVDTVESTIQTRQRRRRVRLAWSLSTAAAVILLLGVWSVSQRAGLRIATRPVAAGKDETAAHDQKVVAAIDGATNTERAVRVVSSDPAAAILVPMETTAPNVTIVWVYPTVKPAILADDSAPN
jgi:anti-sigma factor RsiW